MGVRCSEEDLTSFICNVSAELVTSRQRRYNVSLQDLPHDYDDYFTYIYRVIYAVGLVGNMFALVVWARSKLRSSPVTYFQAICVADSLVLVMHPLEIFYAVHVQGLCQLIHVLFLAVQVFAILLVLGLSVERYIELCHPLAAEMLISHKRTVRTILLLAALSLLASLGEAYLWNVNSSGSRSGSDSGLQCRLRGSASRGFLWTYAFLVLAVLFLCPLVSVVVLHCLVARRIKHRRRNSYAFSDAMVPDKHAMNMSVALVSLYLAVCEIVYACVHISHYFVGEQDEDLPRVGGAAASGGLLLTNGGSAVNGGGLGGAGMTGGGDGGGGGGIFLAGVGGGSALVPESGAEADLPLTGRWHSFYTDALPLMIVDVVALTSYAVDLTIFTLCSRTFRRHMRALFHRYKRRKSLILSGYRHTVPSCPSEMDADADSRQLP